MDKTIEIKQNETDCLLQLSAQRTLYSKAKSLAGFRLILIVPLTVLISITAFLLNNDSATSYFSIEKRDISWFVATFGVVLALLDQMIITPCVKKIKEKAAKIQETFDCYVFNLPWDNVTVGEKPSPEVISKFSKSFRRDIKKIEQLKDWYSKKLGDIPEEAKVIICQRSSLFWDAELRSTFSNYNIVLAIVLIIVLLVVGLFVGLTLKGFFLTVLAPALPVLLYSIRQYYENTEALQELTQLRGVIDDVWKKIIDEDFNSVEVKSLARSIQSKIYTNRKNNPLIFDWFYKLHKDTQHESMHYSVEKQIDKYMKKDN